MGFKRLHKRSFLGETAANALHPHPLEACSATHPSHPGFFIKDELSDHRFLVDTGALCRKIIEMNLCELHKLNSLLCLPHAKTILPSSPLQLPSLPPMVHPSKLMVNRKSTYAYLVRHIVRPLSSPMFATHCLELTFYHTTVWWLEPGIGGKSPPVTEPQFTTGNPFRLIIAIHNSPYARNNRHKPNQTVSGAIIITNGL